MLLYIIIPLEIDRLTKFLTRVFFMLPFLASVGLRFAVYKLYIGTLDAR